MNREILFRGLGLKSRKWIYGNLIHMDDADEDYKDVIIPIEDNCTYVDNDDGYGAEDWHKVESETVGQYTGLKDNNGKEIYEGDIFKNKLSGRIWIVNYKDGAFRMSYENRNIDLLYDYVINGVLENFEIVGNIYENKDLLQQKEND